MLVESSIFVTQHYIIQALQLAHLTRKGKTQALIKLDSILNLTRIKTMLCGIDLVFTMALYKGPRSHNIHNFQNCFTEFLSTEILFSSERRFVSWISGMLLNNSAIYWTQCTMIRSSFSFPSKIKYAATLAKVYWP